MFPLDAGARIGRKGARPGSPKLAYFLTRLGVARREIFGNSLNVCTRRMYRGTHQTR